MIDCPHCQHPLEQIYIYQSVAQRQELVLIGDAPYLRPEITYELPRPATYKFRCGQCRGDVSRFRHRWLAELRQQK